MSDISVFRTTFMLPIAMGRLLDRLRGTFDDLMIPRERKLHWHTSTEREVILKRTYHAEKTNWSARSAIAVSPSASDVLVKQWGHLNAMVSALKKVPVMALTLEKEPAWEKCNKNLASIQSALKTNKFGKEVSNLTAGTDTMIRELTMQTHGKLASVERDVVGGLIIETLQSFGYSLKSRNTTLIGSSPTASLRARVLSGGTVVLDTTAFDGMECHKEVARIETALKSQGVILKRIVDSNSLRDQGVRLQNPFPELEKSSARTTPKIKLTDDENQSSGVDWLQVQRQYNQQKLRIKEG